MTDHRGTVDLLLREARPGLFKCRTAPSVILVATQLHCTWETALSARLMPSVILSSSSGQMSGQKVNPK